MKYIIDTDPGIDDAIAIMLGIKNKMDVIGFTIASGNIPLEKCENNVKVIEEFLGTNIPIYRGRKINACNQEFAEFAHGKDGLGYAVFPMMKHRKVERTYAENFIIKASKKYKDNLTIVCLGPLTNIANALKKDKHLAERIHKIVVMGASYNPYAKNKYIEFNIKVDPEAARTIFNAPFKNIEVVTHEIGVRSYIEKDYILSLAHSDDLISRFIGNIAQKYIEFSFEHYKTIGLGTPDPTTIASIIDPTILEYIPAKIEINDDCECLVTRLKESNLMIAKDLDLDKFRALFKETFK